MWRNMDAVRLILAVLTIQFILFSMAIKHNPTDLKIAIVNGEVNYTNMTYQACHYPPGCKFTFLSCRYLQNLNNDIIQKVYYADPKSAIEAVKTDYVNGALYMTDNFTDALLVRWELEEDADEETLDQSEVKIWLDTSDQQIATVLQQELERSYQTFFEDVIVKDCRQVDGRFAKAENPLSFKDLCNTH